MSKSLMVIAGEISGDMHAAKLVRELKEKDPDLEVWGVGGPEMRAEGVDTLVDINEMAVLGLAEVLRKYFFFKKKFDELLETCQKRKPDAVLLVDYPGFNLRFAKALKPLGIKTIFYICPQVWAWKKGRIQKMAQILDRLLVIFPFEVDLFKGEALPVHFVGHPLVSEIQRALESDPEEVLWPADDRIALLPGSRQQEIERILPVMLASAAKLKAKRPSVGFVIAAASPEIGTQIKEIMRNEADVADCVVVTGKTRDVLRQARAAWVASGTATLETAMIGCPMAVVYVTSPITYAIGRRVVKIPHIGLVNVVAGRELCREFLQGEATPSNLVGEMQRLLDDESYHSKMVADLRQLTETLEAGAGKEDAASLILADL